MKSKKLVFLSILCTMMAVAVVPNKATNFVRNDAAIKGFTVGNLGYNILSGGEGNEVEVFCQDTSITGSCVIPATETYQGVTYSVTQVAEGGFNGCTYSEIVLPESIKTIKNSAFQDCKSLLNVSLFNGLEIIEEYAFNGCNKLESVFIPYSVSSIGESAFGSDSLLKNVYFASTNPLPSFGPSIFDSCSNLENIFVLDEFKEGYKQATNFDSYTEKIASLTLDNVMNSLGENVPNSPDNYWDSTRGCTIYYSNSTFYIDFKGDTKSLFSGSSNLILSSDYNAFLIVDADGNNFEFYMNSGYLAYIKVEGYSGSTYLGKYSVPFTTIEQVLNSRSLPFPTSKEEGFRCNTNSYSLFVSSDYICADIDDQTTQLVPLDNDLVFVSMEINSQIFTTTYGEYKIQFNVFDKILNSIEILESPVEEMKGYYDGFNFREALELSSLFPSDEKTCWINETYTQEKIKFYLSPYRTGFIFNGIMFGTSINPNLEVSYENNAYVYKDEYGITATIHPSNGDISYIEISGMTGDNEKYNGIYKPSLLAVVNNAVTWIDSDFTWGRNRVDDDYAYVLEDQNKLKFVSNSNSQIKDFDLFSTVTVNSNEYVLNSGSDTLKFISTDGKITKIEFENQGDSTFTGEYAPSVHEISKPTQGEPFLLYFGSPVKVFYMESRYYTFDNNTFLAPGVYDVTFTLTDPTYTKWVDGDSEPLVYTYQVNIPNISENHTVDPELNPIDNPVLSIVDSINGVHPEAYFVVSVLDVKNANDVEKSKNALLDANVLDENNGIIAIYDAKLMLNNEYVQPDGAITLKIVVPDKLLDKEFTLYHIHTDSNGTISVTKLDFEEILEGCLFVNIDKLSQFAFVSEIEAEIVPTTKNCIIHWFLIGLLVIGLGLIAFLYFYKKEKLYALISAVFFLLTSVILACLGHCVVCKVFTIINIVLFIAAILFILISHYKKETLDILKKVGTAISEFFKKLGKNIASLCKKFVGFIKNKVSAIKKSSADKKANKPVKEVKKAEQKPVDKPQDIKPVEEEKPVSAPTEEKKEVTLKESISVAASRGAKGIVDKKFVADYLEEKYGSEVEVNRRENATKPGRGKTEGLPLADTHYTLKNGSRKCFIYVYDINGAILFLVKAPSKYGNSLKENHDLVHHSVFPKPRDGSTWFSITVDESWTEDGVKLMLDNVKRLNDDSNYEFNKETEKELTLKESLAVAASRGAKGLVNKKFVADYLEEKYGSEVEVNRRENATKPGRGKTEGLPLADTHYTLKNGSRKCFIYVYEVEGSTLFLVKAPSKYGNSLKENHDLVHHSVFPKPRDGSTWFSITVDESWTEDGVKLMLDNIKRLNDDPDADFDEETEKELTLKESLAVAASRGAKGLVNKKFVADYLEEKYGSEVEVNRRENATKPGRGKTEGLPLADTHYTLKNDCRKCFIYVYEVAGSTLFLLRVPSKYGNYLKENHRLVHHSVFPKPRDGATWFSVTVDDTWSEDGVKKMLDNVKQLNDDPNFSFEEETKEELTLKQSMSVAASQGAKGIVNKNFIADYLEEKYGNEVEVNRRDNVTKPGRGKTEGLPLADTHYTLKNGCRKCFIYVYDINGAILLLIKAPSNYGNGLKENHRLVHHSVFPKPRDGATWFSVTIDNTWTVDSVKQMLDDVKALSE